MQFEDRWSVARGGVNVLQSASTRIICRGFCREKEREMDQMLSLNMVLQGYRIFSRFYGFEISKFGHFSFHQCSSTQCIVVRRHLKAY